MALNDVAYTTDSDSVFNVRVWDPETGAQVATYNGGASQPRTLSFVKGDFIISAHKDKTAFSVWPFQSRDQSNRSFAAPGKVRAMAVSPNGSFCVAGIDCDVYLWNIATGTLVGMRHAHCQPVSVLKFVDDGTAFVTGGHDAYIYVWPIDFFDSDECQPYDMAFADHRQAVQDLCVVGPLVSSVSIWGLLCVHSLQTRCLEYKKLFNRLANAVAMTPNLDAVFVGFKDGTIVRHCLRNTSNEDMLISGHTGPVRCLSVSKHLLLSGSDDTTARVWDAEHGFPLATLSHRGSVTNVALGKDYGNALFKETQKSRASISLRNFQRALSSGTGDDIRQIHDHLEDECDNVPVELNGAGKVRDEYVVPPEMRDTMKKIALANTDIVNFVVANL